MKNRWIRILWLAVCAATVAPAQEDYTDIGTFEPFWRYSAALGGYNGNDFHSGGQGLEVVPDHLIRNNDFPYPKRPYPEENMFADHLSLVRILGGFTGGDSDPVVRALDLVYTNAAGDYLFRSDLLEDRLSPYLDNGYTNFTVVFDNIPWDFTDEPRTGPYGQVGVPRDFGDWTDFVTTFCSNFVDLIGAENTAGLRFRTGTEFHALDRFHGTEAEFMDFYNSCWRGVSNVLPEASFGPYNFYSPSVSQMDTHGGDHNVNSLLIPQEKDPAAPFDWASSSTYYSPGQSTASRLSGLFEVWDEFESRYPAMPPPSREIHEFGILNNSHQEPGALGGAMTAQMIMRLRARGLDKLWHWWMLDKFRDQDNVLQGFLIGDAWLYSIFEHARGGDSWTLYPTGSSSVGTDHLGFYVRKGSEAFLILSAYNTNPSQYTAEDVTFRIPNNHASLDTDRMRFVALNRDTALHDEIHRDLRDQGLLTSYFQTRPQYCGSVREMARDDGAREGESYVGENRARYERFWQHSLTLRPVSERGNISIVEDGDEYRVTARLNVPEVLVLHMPLKHAATVEWNDPAAGGEWNEAENWNPAATPDASSSVLWRYDDGDPALSVTTPVETFQIRAERSTTNLYDNRHGGLRVLRYGTYAGSLTVDDGEGLINMHVDDWYGAQLYVANADSNAAASVVEAATIDLDSFTLGAVPGGNSYYTHEDGYLGMQLDLTLGDASGPTTNEAVFRQTGGQVFVGHRDYPLLIGNANQPGRFILDHGILSSGLSFGNTNGVFEFNAGRVDSGDRDVIWGGVASATGTVQFAGEGTREISVRAGRTLTVNPVVRMEDNPRAAGSFLKNGDGTLRLAEGTVLDLSGTVRVEAGTLALQTRALNPMLSLIVDEEGTVDLDYPGTASVRRVSFDGGQNWTSTGGFDSTHPRFTGSGTLEMVDPYYHWKNPRAGGYWDISTNWVEGAVPPPEAGAVWTYSSNRPVLRITNAVRIADLVVEKETPETENNSLGLYVENWDTTDGSLTVKDGFGAIDMGGAHLRVYNHDAGGAADILEFHSFTGRGFDVSTYGGTSYYTHESGEIRTSVTIGLSMANNPANRVEFRQTGGTVYCDNTDWSLMAGNNNGAGCYILDGGTCSFTLYLRGDTSCLEFNGGTWASRDRNYVWKAPGYAGNVYFAGTGSHIVDVSAGQNLTVLPEVILTDKPGEQGTFRKTGGGEMLVQSGLDLSGATRIEEGTLTISTNRINRDLTVSVDSGARFNLAFSGTAAVHAVSFDGGETWAAPGVWGGSGSGAPNIAPQLDGAGLIRTLTDDLLPRSWKQTHFSEEEIENGLAGESVDSDDDGRDNWHEYVAGTDPRDQASKLVLRIVPGHSPSGCELHFNSVSDRNYGLLYTTNRLPVSWSPLDTNMPGTGEEISVTPDHEFNRVFYRLKVTAP
ncbi:hypothetical protein [Kiritimatiella glycovorans]|uniref:Uncharacterized protein n=1 Tax=Kiritimatiella glycovorans TaxID=1307763 RepID=A0A0G3EM78_9BACT|nr:hypothetical protein [Kiritimatiella glycovorans]AKJ65264.1 hypothetical protein L21SP4_02031 [Kiritimatiella glycovorans]